MTTQPETADRTAEYVCEGLRRAGVLAPGVEFRYAVDLVQIIKDGVMVGTLHPVTKP